MKRRRTLLIIVGAFVLLCCGLGVIATLLGEDVETNGEIASVATEPATTDDTDVVEEPTATPEPTVTLTAVAFYGDTLNTKVSTLYDALQRVQELATEPQMDDQEWIAAFGGYSVVVELAHEEMTAMDVPPEATDLHAAIIDGTADCAAAMPLARQGIDTADIEAMNEGGRLLASCGEKLAETQPALEAFVAEHGR